MSYSTGMFETDAIRTARTLHLAYRRSKYLLDRWWSGINASFPVESYPEINNLMTRVEKLVTDYEANTNSKLNTILLKSDLTLPGDD